MKKLTLVFIFITSLFSFNLRAQDFNRIPKNYKWIGNNEIIFSYNGKYTDSLDFVINARNGVKTHGIKAPDFIRTSPTQVEDASNLTYSPDLSKIAFTRDNDLYVLDIKTDKETRLTFDGSELILNGYASWVYYEEIFGRSSNYRAFWWSPDSKKLGFYRFDNTKVPLFPIYSARGQDGSLINTRYPKAGQPNPEVRIGIINLESPKNIVWADFNEKEDQYFGIPFWTNDSQEFYITRMPRLQNTLDLYAVNVNTGAKKHVYNETYKTWLNWIDDVIFTEKGLYMVRSFETGWEQIYFLSYDGKDFRRLTDGPNWDISLIWVNEAKGDIYFIAKRDATVRQTFYRLDKRGRITALTNPDYHVTNIKFSPNGKYFAATYSNVKTPTRISIFSIDEKKERIVADLKGPDYDEKDFALGNLVYIVTEDGFRLPGMIVFPKNFDSTKKYPVHIDIYGGPNSPIVRDRWLHPSKRTQWWSENDIIQITIDNRAAGHNGREGLDMIYKQLTVWEVKDFISWAKWLKDLPYVNGDKIGVEGFSYGGTMTCMLLMQAPEYFHYGIAGGGVYDWTLYDSHYTERYMDTPQNNPAGYDISKVLNYVKDYPVDYSDDELCEDVMLKLTHGTGDDNVHFQNTLQLIDELHKERKKFDFMIYSDGMHGYRGYQNQHDIDSNREFWLKHLLK